MKADDVSLPAELLRRVLRYDGATGKLYWRERTPDLFPSGFRTAEGNCANWNAIYADTEALGAPQRKGYLGGCLLGHRVKAHRVVFALVSGFWPKGHIDHIDGNVTNNRIENLRDVSNAENHKNVKLQSNNSSGCPGVSALPSGRWRARIKISGQEHTIGSFDTKSEAIAARRAAEKTFGFHPNHGRTDEVLQPMLVGGGRR